MVNQFRLGAHEIGGAKCFIIAEAGVNHDGDVEKAHALVDAAADAGADCVKFQTFVAEQLVSAHAPTAEYQKKNTGSDSQLDLLRGLSLPKAAYAALQQHALRRGMVFLSTPFDEESADLLAELEVLAYKVPSGELTNGPLLAHLARKGKPLLVSTGMATLDEVRTAVAAIRTVAALPIALFHCVSNYPANPADCNLRAMDTLRDAIGVPVGWSDHTMDIHITVAAAALGAQLVEKHLTLDSTANGPDHAASLEPAQFRELVRAVRDVELARGTGIKAPVPAELPTRSVVRRSVHMRVEGKAGHALTRADIALLRPEGGLPPSEIERVVGAVLRRDVSAGAPLAREDLVQ